MIVKLLTEHHFECLSLKGGCRSSSESTHVRMPHYWKSHATAYFLQVLLVTLTPQLKVVFTHPLKVRHYSVNKFSFLILNLSVTYFVLC